MTKFWSSTLCDVLEQGDLLRAKIIGSTEVPPVFLKEFSAKGGKRAWEKTEKINQHYLANGKEISLLVLSHGCAIDKQNGRVAIIVAPVIPISTVPPEHQENIRNARSSAFFPLPKSNVMEESYADFRQITFLKRNYLIEEEDRLLSLTDEARLSLITHLVTYFTGKEAKVLFE